MEVNRAVLIAKETRLAIVTTLRDAMEFHPSEGEAGAACTQQVAY
jgi:hypothetical protein